MNERIAIVSHNDLVYQSLADITVTKNKFLYAKKWNYDLHVQTNGLQHPYGFEKIKQIINLLWSNKYDWLFWCGCDTMITNFTLPITTFIDNQYSFIIATDVNGINADSFLIRNNDVGRAYMSMIISKMPQYVHHYFYEQQVMMDTFNEWRSNIKIVPQALINAYDYKLYPEHVDTRDKLGVDGNWSYGDFLVHWPGTKLDKRLELAAHYLGQVKYD